MFGIFPLKRMFILMTLTQGREYDLQFCLYNDIGNYRIILSLPHTYRSKRT